MKARKLRMTVENSMGNAMSIQSTWRFPYYSGRSSCRGQYLTFFVYMLETQAFRPSQRL